MSANVVGTQRDLWDNGDTKTAPGRCANTSEGLTTDCVGVEMAMADVTPPSGALAARLDGCPSCAENAEVPFGAFNPPSGGMVALYKCTDCGHRWHTSWRA